MQNFILWAIGYSVFCLIFSFVMIYYKRLAFALTILVCVLFPLLSDTSDWDGWFPWVKRYSVIIPSMLWALTAYRLQKNSLSVSSQNKNFLNESGSPSSSIVNISQRFGHFQLSVVSKYHKYIALQDSFIDLLLVNKFFSLILAFNILEASLLEIQKGNFINGALLMFITFLTPSSWSVSKGSKILGFNDVLWVLSSSLCLIYMYIFNPDMDNIVFPAISVLFLALFGVLIKRDHHYWVSFRVYTLYVILVLDSLFPAAFNVLYPDFLHQENRALLKGTSIEYAFLCINLVMTCFLLGQRIVIFRKNNFS